MMRSEIDWAPVLRKSVAVIRSRGWMAGIAGPLDRRLCTLQAIGHVIGREWTDIDPPDSLAKLCMDDMLDKARTPAARYVVDSVERGRSRLACTIVYTWNDNFCDGAWGAVSMLERAAQLEEMKNAQQSGGDRGLLQPEIGQEKEAAYA